MAGLQSALIASSSGGGSASSAWNGATAYAQGQRAISGVDFCEYVRKVAGTTATDPSSDSTNWQPFGARAIKSIQRGLINFSFSAGSGTATATIASVNTSKSTIKQLGAQDGSGTGAATGYVVLTNATTVTANNSGSNAGVIAFEVVESY